MIFASVTNKKVTSKFHVPLQMPAFKCTQRSQEAVTQHKKSARQEVPQTKITTLLYISEVNSSLHEFALQKVALQYIWLCCISHTFFFLGDKKKEFGRDQILPHCIRHFVVCNFVISSFDCAFQVDEVKAGLPTFQVVSFILLVKNTRQYLGGYPQQRAYIFWRIPQHRYFKRYQCRGVHKRANHKKGYFREYHITDILEWTTTEIL